MKCGLQAKDFQLQQLIKNTPLIANAPVIAKGSTSWFFDIGHQRVAKLTLDCASFEFARERLRGEMPSQHLPKVFDCDVLVYRQTQLIYLIEMERLEPLKKRPLKLFWALRRRDSEAWSGSPFSKSVTTTEQKVRQYRHSTYGQRLKMQANWGTAAGELSRSWAKCFKLLGWLVENFGGNNDFHLDVHGKNFMQRKNGTIVFVDPVFSRAIQSKLFTPFGKFRLI